MQETQNTILIVEDNKLGVRILQEILGGDYKLHIATNGQEGIDMARLLKPDLIILDVVLPLKDGYDVIKELKAIPETERIPIIFVTALSHPDDERRGLIMGGADYINKPYDPTIVKLRVDIQIRMVNLVRAVTTLTDEKASLEARLNG